MRAMYVEVCERLLGPSGNYWPEWRSLDRLFCRGVHRTYYDQLYNGADNVPDDIPLVDVRTIRKYCKGTLRLSADIRVHYSSAEGYEKTLADMEAFIGKSICTPRVLAIQRNIHDWVGANLPEAEAAQLSAHYVADDPTKAQVAVYIADVLHYALQAA